MRILFLADNFPPERNAQASRVYERACYWVRWGHEVTVVTCAPNFPEGKLFAGYENKWWATEEMNGIRVVRVKTFIAANAGALYRTVDFLSYMVTGFWAGWREAKPDLVVATSPQFFAAVAGWGLGKVRGVPFVMELSDLWPDSIVAVGAMKKNFALEGLERLELFLYRKAARVVALTGAFKENLVRRGIEGGKIDVVINGVDLERYAPQVRNHKVGREWGIEPSDFVVGYIGTHGMAHALENVLRAAEQMRLRPVKFLFVGAGAERARLVALRDELRLENVVFVPAQGKDRIQDYWSLCDVALVHLKNTPTFETVIPSKIFEAMAMRLPILLASPRGEASRIVERERIGFWVPPEDAGALAEAVERMLADREETALFAETALRAAPRYSREKQARDMAASLELAVGSR